MSRITLGSFVLLLGACGSEPVKPDVMEPPTGFDRSALLTHLSTNVFLPMHAGFAEKAAALPGAIEAHCNALESSSATGTTLEAVQTAFAGAIDAWELAEGVLVGPATAEMNTLRGYIYGWPNLSPCEIDRDVASRWTDPGTYDVSAEFVSTRSLSAIEYLLFPQGTTHNCISAPANWDAMGASLPAARCRLAHAIATDVAAHGAALATEWQTTYATELARAGSGSSIATAQAAVNLISDGMFYVDKMVKDMKLGEAAGIALNACDAVQAPCVREVELRYADRSTFAIRANLAALRQVFTGEGGAAPGVGFDDYLAAVGHADVGARMLASLDDAIAKANALPDSFLSALDTNYAGVVATHAAVKAFTDDLKSQFLTVLALEIPDDVAADND